MKLNLAILIALSTILYGCGSTEKKEDKKEPAPSTTVAPSNINVYCAPGNSTSTK
jgi:uncharacterized protein YceK